MVQTDWGMVGMQKRTENLKTLIFITFNYYVQFKCIKLDIQ